MRGAEIKQEGHRRGQEPSAFHRKDEALKDRKHTWTLEGIGMQWSGDLVLEPDKHVCDPTVTFTSPVASI